MFENMLTLNGPNDVWNYLHIQLDEKGNNFYLAVTLLFIQPKF